MSGLRGFERSLPIALLRAREATMRLFKPHVDAAGLTLPQWRVIRALARAGADARARRWLTRAEARWPDDPHVTLARAQLASGELKARSEREHEARCAMRDGDADRALALAEAFAADHTGRARAWAHGLAASALL